MKDLLLKEFKLALHPTILMFPILGALLLIPSYPYFVAFIYTFIAFINIFVIGRANQDILFTVSLPVRKRDAVKARLCMIASVELLQIIVAIPFAIISGMINPQGNAVGIDANCAFFGLVLVMYAVFNFLFFPMFYKTAYKVAMPFFISCTAVVLYIGAAEAAVQAIPFLKAALDSPGAGSAALQVLVLLAGAVIFCLSLLASYKKAADNFEKVDL